MQVHSIVNKCLQAPPTTAWPVASCARERGALRALSSVPTDACQSIPTCLAWHSPCCRWPAIGCRPPGGRSPRCLLPCLQHGGPHAGSPTTGQHWQPPHEGAGRGRRQGMAGGVRWIRAARPGCSESLAHCQWQLRFKFVAAGCWHGGLAVVTAWFRVGWIRVRVVT
jgi:hypothetical protein